MPTEMENSSTINPSPADEVEAQTACTKLGRRFERVIREYEANGEFSQGEALTLAWEEADLDSPTWTQTLARMVVVAQLFGVRID